MVCQRAVSPIRSRLVKARPGRPALRSGWGEGIGSRVARARWLGPAGSRWLIAGDLNLPTGT